MFADLAAYAHVLKHVHAPRPVEPTTDAQPSNGASTITAPSLVIGKANTVAMKATTDVLDFGSSSKVLDSALALNVALGASVIIAGTL